MKHLSLCGLTLLLLLTCCKSRPKLSPEETVKIWQSSIDRNQFDQARELSVGEAMDYVNELAGYNTGSDTLAWENNALLNLKCQIIGDSAICSYNFEDELGNPSPGQLALRRIEGYWFVSRTDFDNFIPSDTLQPGEDDMLFPADSLEEEMEE